MNNYRPISVISVVANIFEKFTFEQLYEYLNNNNLVISASRSGFRSLHSTLSALIEATDNWSINIEGLLNGVIFIDLKKAFDTIDHTILLRKLR